MTEKEHKRIAEITEEVKELFSKIDELRKEENSLVYKDFDYTGKYVKIVSPEYDCLYMYVYSSFPLFSENKFIIRGVAFYHDECEYWDGSFFNWQTDADFSFNPQFMPEVSITEITEEEYNEKFEESVHKFLEHKKNFVDKEMKNW